VESLSKQTCVLQLVAFIMVMTSGDARKTPWFFTFQVDACCRTYDMEFAIYEGNKDTIPFVYCHCSLHLAPKVVVEWLALLLRIRKVLCQISARRAAILIWVFRGFHQSLQVNSGIVP
jgi:hypothetical protein